MIGYFKKSIVMLGLAALGLSVAGCNDDKDGSAPAAQQDVMVSGATLNLQGQCTNGSPCLVIVSETDSNGLSAGSVVFKVAITGTAQQTISFLTRENRPYYAVTTFDLKMLSDQFSKWIKASTKPSSIYPFAGSPDRKVIVELLKGELRGAVKTNLRARDDLALEKARLDKELEILQRRVRVSTVLQNATSDTVVVTASGTGQVSNTTVAKQPINNDYVIDDASDRQMVDIQNRLNEIKAAMVNNTKTIDPSTDVLNALADILESWDDASIVSNQYIVAQAFKTMYSETLKNYKSLKIVGSSKNLSDLMIVTDDSLPVADYLKTGSPTSASSWEPRDNLGRAILYFNGDNIQAIYKSSDIYNEIIKNYPYALILGSSQLILEMKKNQATAATKELLYSGVLGNLCYLYEIYGGAKKAASCTSSGMNVFAEAILQDQISYKTLFADSLYKYYNMSSMSEAIAYAENLVGWFFTYKTTKDNEKLLAATNNLLNFNVRYFYTNLFPSTQEEALNLPYYRYLIRYFYAEVGNSQVDKTDMLGYTELVSKYIDKVEAYDESTLDIIKNLKTALGKITLTINPVKSSSSSAAKKLSQEKCVSFIPDLSSSTDVSKFESYKGKENFVTLDAADYESKDIAACNTAIKAKFTGAFEDMDSAKSKVDVARAKVQLVQDALKALGDTSNYKVNTGFDFISLDNVKKTPTTFTATTAEDYQIKALTNACNLTLSNLPFSFLDIAKANDEVAAAMNNKSNYPAGEYVCDKWSAKFALKGPVFQKDRWDKHLKYTMPK